MSWCEPTVPRQAGRGPGAFLRAALVFGVLVFAAGCGFQVRGAPSIPPALAVTHIETQDRYSPFYRKLTSVLRQNGVTLTDDPTKATAVIRVLTDETDRRLLSVSTGNVPTEYEVFYRVRFAVVVDGQEVVPVEQLALSRDYTFDEFRVLGKAGEEAVLRDSLADDLVGLVTRRLSTVRAPEAEAPQPVAP